MCMIYLVDTKKPKPSARSSSAPGSLAQIIPEPNLKTTQTAQENQKDTKQTSNQPQPSTTIEQGPELQKNEEKEKGNKQDTTRDVSTVKQLKRKDAIAKKHRPKMVTPPPMRSELPKHVRFAVDISESKESSPTSSSSSEDSYVDPPATPVPYFAHNRSKITNQAARFTHLNLDAKHRAEGEADDSGVINIGDLTAIKKSEIKRRPRHVTEHLKRPGSIFGNPRSSINQKPAPESVVMNSPNDKKIHADVNTSFESSSDDSWTLSSDTESAIDPEDFGIYPPTSPQHSEGSEWEQDLSDDIDDGFAVWLEELSNPQKRNASQLPPVNAWNEPVFVYRTRGKQTRTDKNEPVIIRNEGLNSKTEPANGVKSTISNASSFTSTAKIDMLTDALGGKRLKKEFSKQKQKNPLIWNHSDDFDIQRKTKYYPGRGVTYYDV